MKFEDFYKEELKRNPKLKALDDKYKKVEKILNMHFGKDDSLRDERMNCIYEIIEALK